jgi:hypothetical protein
MRFLDYPEVGFGLHHLRLSLGGIIGCVETT